MTTKEQERKALERIRKIVDELGENSYIGMAFEGCFDDAEENIEYDWGLSMNGRWQDAEQRVEQYKVIRDELVEENKALTEKIDDLTAQIASLETILNKLREMWNDESRRADLEHKQIGFTIKDGGDVLGDFEKFELFQDTTADGKPRVFSTLTSSNGWAESHRLDNISRLVIK